MNKLLAPLLIGLIGGGILISLGVWQLQRMAWKQGMLEAIEARIHDVPVALPASPDPEAHQYLPVRLSGTIGEPDLEVLASVRGVGPGYRVIAPFELDDGRRILLDRGFVALSAKDAPRPPVHATITGNLHWPDERDASTPVTDMERGIWFARDIEAMARVLDTEPVLVVLRESDEAVHRATPYPVSTADIPNRHLEYVVTWFGLALVWFGMTGYWIWRIRRKTD